MAVIKSESFSRIAYNYLLNAIFDQTVEPGQLLNRHDIAKKLGISVAPVLEAMVMLENEGFVESIPRKGTQVRIIRDTDVTGYLFVRAALECMAVRFYCGGLISRELNRFLPMAERLDDLSSLDSQECIKIDWELHKELIALCRIDVLDKEYNRTCTMGHFFRLNRLVDHIGRRVQNQHTDLIRSLCDATPDTAQKIMYDHVWSGRARRFMYTGPDGTSGNAV